MKWERPALERAALAGLPADDPLVVAQRRRLVGALEEARIATYLLGVEFEELRIPFAIRADAWLTRTRRLLVATERPPLVDCVPAAGGSGAVRARVPPCGAPANGRLRSVPDGSGAQRRAVDDDHRRDPRQKRTEAARSGAIRAPSAGAGPTQR